MSLATFRGALQSCSAHGSVAGQAGEAGPSLGWAPVSDVRLQEGTSIVVTQPRETHGSDPSAVDAAVSLVMPGAACKALQGLLESGLLSTGAALGERQSCLTKRKGVTPAGASTWKAPPKPCRPGNPDTLHGAPTSPSLASYCKKTG